MFRILSRSDHGFMRYHLQQTGRTKTCTRINAGQRALLLIDIILYRYLIFKAQSTTEIPSIQGGGGGGGVAMWRSGVSFCTSTIPTSYGSLTIAAIAELKWQTCAPEDQLVITHSFLLTTSKTLCINIRSLTTSHSVKGNPRELANGRYTDC